MDFPSAEKIIRAFAAIMEKGNSPSLGTQVADVNELPYAKTAIMEAFSVAYLNAEDDERRKFLENGYIFLTGWQVGVGPQRIGTSVDKAEVEKLKAGSTEDLQRFAKEFGAQMKEYKKWELVIEADQKLMLAEIERLRSAVKGSR